MRMRRWWGLGTALLLAWGAPFARATDENGETGRRPDVRPIDRPGLIDKLFDLTAPDKKPDAKAQKRDAAKAGEKIAGDKRNPAASPTMSDLTRQDAALFRRLEVCDKLREIALETNNKELDQLAEELDARARAVYAQRTARLHKNGAATDIDEKMLDKKLGIEPMNPEQMPAGKPAAARTGKGDRAQAASREDDR
jgi:hypothetical protein